MGNITLHGQAVQTIGTLPLIGSPAPSFSLCNSDLKDFSLQDFRGKNIILNIFPSLDTPTCSKSVRQFNSQAALKANTVILCISADLPFAHKRFCVTENINNLINASVFRHPEFGKAYGLEIIDSPLKGLLSRAVIVLDPQGIVLYSEQVAELSNEPNYQLAFDSILSD
jgi:thiol peroxidase